MKISNWVGIPHSPNSKTGVETTRFSLMSNPGHHLSVWSKILSLFQSLQVIQNSVSWWYFNWILSISKFPQVTRTLLSILTDLNNDIEWIVVICLTISNSSSPLSKLWGTVQARQLELVYLSSSDSSTFLSLWQVPGTCRSFSFLFFSPYGPLRQYSSLFYVDYHLVCWPWLGDRFLSHNSRELN